MRLKKVQKANPSNREEPKKYYLLPVYAGELTIKELAKALSEACTLNTADITAVLEALTTQMPWYLANGFIIQLGAMGRFKLSVHSRGQPEEKAVTTNDVTATKVIFTPSAAIKKELEGTSFTVE